MSPGGRAAPTSVVTCPAVVMAVPLNDVAIHGPERLGRPRVWSGADVESLESVAGGSLAEVPAEILLGFLKYPVLIR